MCGIALEAMWKEKNCSGLKDLLEKGFISASLYHHANEVRYWDNIIKHKQPDTIDKDDVRELLGYSEAVLNAVYVDPKRLDALKQKREQLDKK